MITLKLIWVKECVVIFQRILHDPLIVIHNYIYNYIHITYSMNNCKTETVIVNIEFCK